MQTIHLRDAVDAILSDYKTGALLTKLDTLTNTYVASVQSPTSQSAEAFDKALEDLTQAVADGRCDDLPPSRQRVIEEIGGADFCGQGLVHVVMDALNESPSPASTVERLQLLRTSVSSFLESLTALRESFAKLKLSSERPDPDVASVEISLPGALFDQHLGPLAKEAERLNRMLQDIGEVVTGERPQIRVEGAGSGSVDFYLSVDLGSGAALLTFITSIVQLVNATVELRKQRASLEHRGAPKDVLEPMKTWEEERISDELKRLVDEAIKKSPLDKPRKAEMKKALSASLKYLANRIDRGMDIDVYTQMTASRQSAGGETETTTAVPNAKERQAISEASGAIKRIERGSEPVLRLPSGTLEPPNGDDGDQG